MTRRRGYPLAAALLALAAAGPSALADNLVADLSENVIAIRSNFIGQQLVLFGAIDRAADSLSGNLDPDGPRDIIVVIRGPNRPVTVRRKERVAGIWVNTESIEFEGVPSYFFAAANRKFDDVAPPSFFRRQQTRAATLNMTAKDDVLTPEDLATYREAIIRNKQREGLFYEEPEGVRFLDRTLFRATVTIPANVPVGIYKAEVYLIQDGRVIGVQSKSLEIDKSGFERTIYEFAYDSPLVYGVLAVLFALGAGWVASVAMQEH